jgi:hypothetical protein
MKEGKRKKEGREGKRQGRSGSEEWKGVDLRRGWNTDA